jgi:hypothetical protein
MHVILSRVAIPARDDDSRGLGMTVRAWMICGAAIISACATTTEPVTPASASWPQVNVFVVGHEDDWQLFMNPEAFHSMNEPGEKAVFVHLTAGDAGRGTTGEPTPYYLAREEGALRAIRFMANARPDTGLGVEMQRETAQRGGHNVQRVAYDNAVAYFLRLPDGNYEGPGYETTGWQSLERLRTGAIAAIEAVDASASYTGWDDLAATLADIVRSEMRSGDTLGLHIPEKHSALNPEDHSDHRNTAMAMEAAAAQFPCASIHRYDEYATNERAANVEGTDYMIDVGTWAATASGLSDSHAFSTWDPVHNSWLGRSYSRITWPEEDCSAVAAEAR